MSPELIKEIIKSHVYGMSVVEMAQAYGLTEDTPQHIMQTQLSIKQFFLATQRVSKLRSITTYYLIEHY